MNNLLKWQTKLLIMLFCLIAGAGSQSVFAQKAPAIPQRGDKAMNCTKEQQGRPGSKANLSPTERAEKATQKMTKRYNLSSEQQAKISDINRSFADQSSRLRQDNDSKSRYENYSEMEQLRQQKEAAIEKVLTPDQAKQFRADKQEMQQKKEERLAERRENRPPAGERAEKMTERMTQKLGLNEKQAQAVKDINLKTANAIEGVLNNTKLDKGAQLKEIEQLQQQKERELKAVLTPEQTQKLEQMKEQHRENRGEGRPPHNKGGKGGKGGKGEK